MVFERIRNLREDNDIKQREIADYLHISQNTYSQYETGKISLSAETAVKLAKFYGVSVDYLLGLSDNKTTTNLSKTNNF
ncbi:MAG: helix-turn-helix transcriptional regulator [Ruminiclostridium sp.]|nr:helix-turn-helix transcriptional regulator [Ruminiclostridium sp.]MBQ8410852.1 helix-turn-helix transcriptional regulator [Ruminiclostridium sp.]MBQ8841136.1 helix-turn-helix transcriptional regulator [Ruminiclostridium sp.]